MQGGREPGRSVYTVRRILAALIVLLLLVLLVPQACQALLGTGNETGSGAPDTVDVNGPSDEEGATTVEESADDTESAERESIEEESATESSSEVEQARSEDDASEASDGDARNVEFDASLAQADVGLDATVAGGADQIAPIPVVDLAFQQQVQPIALGEPVVFQQPIVAENPVPLEPPVVPTQPIAPEPSVQEPILPAEPALLGELIPFAQELIFFEEDPAFFVEPTFLEAEPVFFEEPGVSDVEVPATPAPTAENEVGQESASETQGGSSEAATVAIASGGDHD
jgi:hypothetical protein